MNCDGIIRPEPWRPRTTAVESRWRQKRGVRVRPRLLVELGGEHLDFCTSDSDPWRLAQHTRVHPLRGRGLVKGRPKPPRVTGRSSETVGFSFPRHAREAPVNGSFVKLMLTKYRRGQDVPMKASRIVSVAFDKYIGSCLERCPRYLDAGESSPRLARSRKIMQSLRDDCSRR